MLKECRIPRIFKAGEDPDGHQFKRDSYVNLGPGHGFEVVRRAVPRSARKVSKMASKFLV